MIGKTISHYKILEKIGEGGMGVVYKAEDTKLKRTVALKFLPAELTRTAEWKERFIREAQAAAALDHPNICTLYETYEVEGEAFISMAFCDGQGLDEKIESEPLNVDEAVGIAIQIAEGLQEAHDRGIVHRDIKSANIMISRRGQAKVMDFGLAKLVGRTKLTGTGTIMGTVDYMSPEQARGEPVDHQTDIWSLGVVLYEMLTGQRLFTAESDAALIHKIIYEEPTGVRGLNPDVPSGLSIVLARAMAKNKEDRYASISEFLGDIRDFKALEEEKHGPGKKRRDTRPMGMMAAEEVTAAFIAERTPFVGRNSERAELQRFLLQAAQGQGTLVMIGGEPGVGKTRITEELVAEARRHGFLTLTGHCYEMEGAPPYIPFVEILQLMIRTVEPDVLLDALGTAAPEAAKLAPELREQFPDIPEPRKLGPEQERLFLFNNIRDFFERLASRQPLLLVIEDLHWTDEPTLLLLQHIAQRLNEMPVLMVGTYRDTELDVARSLAKALQELLRQRMVHDLILKRLPQEGVSAMLRGRSGQEPPSRLVETIYHETEGNPFFVEEVFKHLAEEEKLFDAEGQWRTDLRIDELDVPRGVLLVIGHRLARVTQECQRTLTTAAVIGRGVRFKLLNKVIELDEDALLDAIEDAERAQLISTKTGAGEAQLIFAHELIRQTLLSDISTPRRQRLHLRVAEAMERLYAEALEQHAADLAYHFYQAGGDAEKIIEYAVLAAERATAQTAYEEAVEQYQRALQALEQLKPIDELRQCDVLLLLGRAHGNAGDPDHAKETFLKVAEIARRLPAPEQFAEAMVGIVEFWFTFGYVDSQLLNLMEESLALLPEEDSALRASLLGRLAYLMESVGDITGITLSEQAIAMARRVGDPEALWYALFARVFVWDRPLEERIADATDLARLEEDGTCPVMGDQGLNYLSHLHRVKGDIAAFDADLAVFKKRAAEVPHPTTVWTAKFIEGAHTQLLGRFDESEQMMVEAFTLGQKMDEMVRFQGFSAFMYGLRYTQGRLSELAHPSIATEQYPYLRDVPTYRVMRAHFDCIVGRTEQAREEFEHLAANDFGDLPRNWGMPVCLVALSEIAAALGDTRRAALLYDLLLACAERLRFMGINNACLGTKSHWLGLLATTLKRWDDALAHFEDALELSARVGTRPWLARSQHEYARMLIERNNPGDEEKAKELLTEAITTYRELGMPTYLENAEELMKRV